jgi:hypothetical protein
MGSGAQGGNIKALDSAEPSQVSNVQQSQTGAFRTKRILIQCASTPQHPWLIPASIPQVFLGRNTPKPTR